MSVSLPVFLVIVGSAIVTFLPRVLPFMVIRTIPLPKAIIKWLQFIPICILSALVVNSILIKKEDVLSIDGTVLLAIVPTLIIALWTKSLSITVLSGVVFMAAVRLFL